MRATARISRAGARHQPARRVWCQHHRWCLQSKCGAWTHPGFSNPEGRTRRRHMSTGAAASCSGNRRIWARHLLAARASTPLLASSTHVEASDGARPRYSRPHVARHPRWAPLKEIVGRRTRQATRASGMSSNARADRAAHGDGRPGSTSNRLDGDGGGARSSVHHQSWHANRQPIAVSDHCNARRHQTMADNTDTSTSGFTHRVVRSAAARLFEDVRVASGGDAASASGTAVAIHRRIHDLTTGHDTRWDAQSPPGRGKVPVDDLRSALPAATINYHRQVIGISNRAPGAIRLDGNRLRHRVRVRWLRDRLPVPGRVMDCSASRGFGWLAGARRGWPAYGGGGRGAARPASSASVAGLLVVRFVWARRIEPPPPSDRSNGFDGARAFATGLRAGATSTR